MMFKQLMRVAAVALLSTTAAAGSYAPACHCEITIPKFKGGFRLWDEKEYFSPYLSGTVFAETRSNEHVDKHNISPDFKLGFGIGVTYEFVGTGNDFEIAYHHHMWRGSDTKHGEAGLFALHGNSNMAPFIAQQPLNLAANFAKGNYEWNNAFLDMEFGQSVNLGHSVTIRFHSGLRYADYDARFKARVFYNASEGVGQPDDMFSVQFKTAFDGVGPRVGLDCIFHLNDSFDLMTEGATAMLIGDLDNKTFVKTTLLNVTSWKKLSLNCKNYLVGTLDLRAGGRFHHTFDNGYNLAFEAGYQATSYLASDGKMAPIKTVAQSSKGCPCDLGFHGLFLKTELQF